MCYLSAYEFERESARGKNFVKGESRGINFLLFGKCQKKSQVALTCLPQDRSTSNVRVGPAMSFGSGT